MQSPIGLSLISRVPVKPLFNTSIKISIPPLSMLYLGKVLMIHLKKCVFYIIYKLNLPLHVSFKSCEFGLRAARFLTQYLTCLA